MFNIAKEQTQAGVNHIDTFDFYDPPTAIAEAGYPMHVWARRPGSLDALGNVSHIRDNGSKDLAAVCDIVALCVGTDEDVMQIVEEAHVPR